MILSIVLLLPIAWSAAVTTQRTQGEILAIYEQFRASNNDILKVVLASDQLFDDCMKSQKIAISIRLFHEAFIMKRGVMHDLPERNGEEVVASYYEDYIKSQRKALEHLILLYLNSSKEEQLAMQTFFNTHQTWIPEIEKYDYLKPIAKILGEEVVNERVPFHRAIDVGVRLNARFGFFYDCMPSLLGSLLTHDWKMEPSSHEAIMTMTQKSCSWYQLDQLFSKILNASKDKVLPLVVECLSEQSPEVYRYQINDMHLLPETKKAVLLEAAKQKHWPVIANFFTKQLTPSIYMVMREIDPVHYPTILPNHLRRPKNMAVLYAIYNMARFLDGKESPAIEKHLCKLLKLDSDMKATKTVNVYGEALPINQLPDELLSRILYESTDSLAFSELVLKRVCKRWSELVNPEGIVVNNIFLAQQYIEAAKEHRDNFPILRDPNKEQIVPILAKWPVSLFHDFEENYRRINLKIPKLAKAKPPLLAGMIRNIASVLDVFGSESREYFEFPAVYGHEKIGEFTRELVLNGPYPVHFKTLPEMTAQMLNTLVENEEFPSSCKEVIATILEQTLENKGSLVKVLIEHRLDAKYHKTVIDHMIQGEELEQAIIDLIPTNNDDYGEDIERLCSRFIVRHVLDVEPNMTLTGFSDTVTKYLLPEAFVEAKSSHEFDNILSAALRFNNGSMFMLNKTILDALSVLLKKKYTIKDIHDYIDH